MRYLESKKIFLFSKVPPLIQHNKIIMEGEAQKANKLFSAFYLLLLNIITEECEALGVIPIKDYKIGIKEVKVKVFNIRS